MSFAFHYISFHIFSVSSPSAVGFTGATISDHPILFPPAFRRGVGDCKMFTCQMEDVIPPAHPGSNLVFLNWMWLQGSYLKGILTRHLNHNFQFKSEPLPEVWAPDSFSNLESHLKHKHPCPLKRYSTLGKFYYVQHDLIFQSVALGGHSHRLSFQRRQPQTDLVFTLTDLHLVVNHHQCQLKVTAHCW